MLYNYFLFYFINDKRMFLEKLWQGLKKNKKGKFPKRYGVLFFSRDMYFGITSECFINPEIQRNCFALNQKFLFICFFEDLLRYFLFCFQDYAKTVESSCLSNIKILKYQVMTVLTIELSI